MKKIFCIAIFSYYLNDHVANGIYYVVIEGDGWKKAQKIAVVKSNK